MPMLKFLVYVTKFFQLSFLHLLRNLLYVTTKYRSNSTQFLLKRFVVLLCFDLLLFGFLLVRCKNQCLCCVLVFWLHYSCYIPFLATFVLCFSLFVFMVFFNSLQIALNLIINSFWDYSLACVCSCSRWF